MKQFIRNLIILILILAIEAIGFIFGFYIRGPNITTVPSAPVCITGSFVATDDEGNVWVLGKQQLCGQDLRFGDIVPPAQEYY